MSFKFEKVVLVIFTSEKSFELTKFQLFIKLNAYSNTTSPNKLFECKFKY